MLNNHTREDELCVCVAPGCCHLHLFRFAEDADTEYWWYTPSSHGMCFWDRVKIAWQLVRGRESGLNDMMMGEYEARQVRDWLTKHLDKLVGAECQCLSCKAHIAAVGKELPSDTK